MQTSRRRWLLLLLAAALSLAIILVVSVQQDPKLRLNLPAAATNPALAASVPTSPSLSLVTATGVLQGADYRGTTPSGASWQVLAQQAKQFGTTDAGTVTLTSATAQWRTPNQPQPLTLAAPQAEFTQTDQQLAFSQGVQLSGPLAGGVVQVLAPQATAQLTSQTVRFTGTLAAPVKLTLSWPNP